MERDQDLTETEKFVKKQINRALDKAAEAAPAVVSSAVTRPVMNHAIKTTYESVLRKELASTTAERAVIRASEAAAQKGFAHLGVIQRVAGPVAGALVSPIMEVGQVAYQEHVKGEVRTSEDYKNAAIRGTATGVAGTAATAYTALVAGVLCPPLAPVLALAAGIGASGFVGTLFNDNS
jgi:hypothetical protein